MEQEDIISYVRGKAMLSIPLFILKKFGDKKYRLWLNSLSPEARKIYRSQINKDDWYSLKGTIIEPTRILCDLFYNGSTIGAWKCGRFGAEYGLKGIYKMLVKLCSPSVLIKKARPIMLSYYTPSEIEITEEAKHHVIFRITEFPDIDEIIEYRIAGWIERAVEISGCKHVTVNITEALSKNDLYTEYKISWR